MSDHTPTPWHANGTTVTTIGLRPLYVLAQTGTVGGQCAGEEKATAAFIVRACNAHDDLVEALELAVQYVGKGVAEGAYDGCIMPGEKALDAIEAALAKAKGE